VLEKRNPANITAVMGWEYLWEKVDEDIAFRLSD